MLPAHFAIYLTSFCQLACSHCFLTRTGRRNREQLDLQNIDRIIADAANHNVFMLVIAGGDPSLHPAFSTILRLLRSKRILPLISLTGVDVSNDLVEVLHSSGVTCVQVSLDGYDEQTNGKYRYPGTFSHIIQGIARFSGRGLKVNLAITARRENLHCITRLLDLAQELGIFKVKIGMWVDSGGEDSSIAALDERDIQELLVQCRLYQEQAKLGDWIIIPGYDVRSGSPIEAFSKYPPLVIESNGNLRCTEFGEVFGHIKNETVSQQYSLYCRRKKIEFLHALVGRESLKYGVVTIKDAPGEKLRAGGAVYQDEQGFHILLADSLSPFLRGFLALHEIGHLALRELVLDPRRKPRATTETAINKWALDLIANNLEPIFRTDLLRFGRRRPSSLSSC